MEANVENLTEADAAPESLEDAEPFDFAMPEGSLEARRIALMRRETLELMDKECKAYTDRLEAVKSIRFVLNRAPNAFFMLSPFALGRAPATKNPVKTQKTPTKRLKRNPNLP